MKIEIADSVLRQAHLSEQDLKLELALILYQRNSFTLGQASKFAGLHQFEFQKKLKERNIYLHYDMDMLNNDLKFVNEP